MDRFRLDDPDAAEKAWDIFMNPLPLTEWGDEAKCQRALSRVLDAIEQPRLPTRSEVEAKFRAKGFYAPQPIADLVIELGGATEDPEPAEEDEYPERAPGFVLGYYEGWADAKAGRQYGEGRHGRWSGLVDTEEPTVGP